MDFSQLCSCGPSGYACLKQRVDCCARQGHSYEFPQCRLPEGCVPEEARLGFWRQGESYLVYLSPPVIYHGAHPQLSAFFRHGGLQAFPSFPLLVRCLQALDIQIPLSPFRRLDQLLQSAVLGQEEAVEGAAFKLWGHISKRQPARPLSLILYGPTCVGKSELGKAVAPALNQLCGEERYRLVWTELNTFTQAHSVYRLTGAPPGYVGYDDPPVLEAVRRCPYTVFMFDELDKAHPEILKVFMSILDEGRCTARREDESGSRELDFRRCIFLFTTNTDLSGEKRRLGFSLEEPKKDAAVPSAGPASLAQRLFQADERARLALIRSGVLGEIAGRFSGLIGFRPLEDAVRVSITARQITALGREFGLEIVYVAPDIARALTPEGGFSPRSAVGVLEGALTPLFLTAGGGAFQLVGTLEDMRLLPLAG